MSKRPTKRRATAGDARARAKQVANLIRSCWAGDLKAVRQALTDGISPDEPSERTGGRPLTAATDGNQIRVVRFLLDKGADPEHLDSGTSMPPYCSALELAASKGYTDIVRLLIERGADVNKAGYWPPLKSAASHGQLETARLLLEAGAKMKSSWLMLATRVKNARLVKLLLDAGADPKYASPEGKTALHIAAINPNPDVAELLLAAGAKVDAINADTWLSGTPLFVAAEHGALKTAQLLVRAGADFRFKGLKGKTPEQRARTFKKKDVADFLREYAKHLPKEQHPVAVPDLRQDRPVKKKTTAPKTIVHSTTTPPRDTAGSQFGAYKLVSDIISWGHPEWEILAVEAPLESATSAYSKIADASRCVRGIPVRPAQKSDPGVSDWVGVVQSNVSDWVVIFRMVSVPCSGFERLIAEGKEISKTLGCRALAFMGEHVSSSMQCDLFKKGKHLESHCWENQGADADGLLGKLRIYMPVCYTCQKGESVWLSVCPASDGKVQSADALRLAGS